METDGDESQALRDRAVEHWQALLKNWRRRALRNKRTSRLLIFGSVLLSVGTTAMSGIPTVPRWWIVISSAGAALTLALMGATRSHEQWTASREVQNRLYVEKFLFEQGAGPYADTTGDERTRLFSVRMTEVGMAGHDAWAGHVSEAVTTVRGS
jgi:Protein of unknown function (DUF4231)